MFDISTLHAANDHQFKSNQRDRTVPIPSTITPIPGYPTKLVVYKIAASKYWHIRCWMSGKTHKRSSKSQSLRVAIIAAKRFYEELSAKIHLTQNRLPIVSLLDDEETRTKPSHTFSALAAQVMANEKSRVARGEFSHRSVQVMQNRLDTYILPRWGKLDPKDITYERLCEFSQFLSNKLGSISVSQYFVIIRKILTHAQKIGTIDAPPAFPKVKVVTTPRGAFTPSEYWKLLRTARQLRGQQHPATVGIQKKHFKLRAPDYFMREDVAWIIGFMVNSFIRPSDLKTLKHKHVEVVRNSNTYLRLSLPETKKHNKPIVTLQPAVRIYEHLKNIHSQQGEAGPDDYLFFPQLRDRNYAQFVMSYFFKWVMDINDLRIGPHGQNRTLYSLRHSAITFRLLYGQGIDLLTLARNSRTSIEVINNHYASTVSSEQNIALLQSRRIKH